VLLSQYLRQGSSAGENTIFEFLWRDPDLRPQPIAKLPLSRYFGGPYGWMIARTGWDDDAVIAEMKVNEYNFVNHQHLDAGAFQIYYKGPLAIDSGLYEGANGAYGSPHHENYYKRTIAHNSLLIYDPAEKFMRSSRELRNDGGQRLPGGWSEPRNVEVLTDPARGYKTGAVLGHGFGPDPRRPAYTYLKGDITGAYSAKVKSIQRSFVFLNLGGSVPAALVVFDRVVSSDPAFRKYWLLHSMEEPAVAGNTVTLKLSERGWTGKLVNTALLPETPQVEKTGGPGKEFMVFGENYPNEVRPGRRPEDYEIGAWRAEITPRDPAATDCFLNVMEMMDTAVAPLPVERLESAGAVGVRVADRLVWFQRSGARTDRPVSFTARGAGTLQFLVADLAEGVWQVWRDGAIVHPALNVAAGEGTLYFQGPAGAYSLRR
jgi:heparin/heparan-sulfate lyase